MDDSHLRMFQWVKLPKKILVGLFPNLRMDDSQLEKVAVWVKLPKKGIFLNLWNVDDCELGECCSLTLPLFPFTLITLENVEVWNCEAMDDWRWGWIGEKLLQDQTDLASESFNVNDLSNYFLQLFPQFYFFGITFITLHNLMDVSEGKFVMKLNFLEIIP